MPHHHLLLLLLGISGDLADLVHHLLVLKYAFAPPPKAEIDSRRWSADFCDIRRRIAACSLMAASDDEPSIREPSHAASAGESPCIAPSTATFGISVHAVRRDLLRHQQLEMSRSRGLAHQQLQRVGQRHQRHPRRQRRVAVRQAVLARWKAAWRRREEACDTEQA